MRHKLNEDDRALQEEIERSTKVSSYLDSVYDAISTGNVGAVKGKVPNYREGSSQEGLAHETGGFSMDIESLYQASSQALGENGQPVAKTASKENKQPLPPKPGALVSESQFRALRKYPQIVEFLGTDQGAKLATKIISDINEMIAEKIGENAKIVHPNAFQCVAHKQFLHQFFQGEGWACKVTANGPFRGNEVIFFKEDEDKSFVLRQAGDKYKDVSEEFNIVHDYRVVETQNA